VDELNRQICQLLDTKDIRLIEEILARVETSRQRVRTTMNASRLARDHATDLRNSVHALGLLPHFDVIATRRRKAFKSSPFYQLTLPHLKKYFDSRAHLVPTYSGMLRKDITAHAVS